MKRGDLVTIALQGDYGKPRPAVIIQSDSFVETPSVTVLPISNDLQPASLCRITILPDPFNGLKKTSQVMVDKTYTTSREKIGPVIGHLDDAAMIEVTRCLAFFLGFGS